MSRLDIKFMQVLVDSMVGIDKFSYPARRNAPRPKENFCTIALIEQHVIGTPVGTVLEIFKTNTNEVIGHRHQYATAATLRFRIGVYGSDGLPEVKIVSSWTTEKSKAIYKEYGYGYIMSHHIALEDELLEKDWNARVGFSVNISTTRYVHEDITLIKYAGPIQGQILQDCKLVDVIINEQYPQVIEVCDLIEEQTFYKSTIN